MDVFTQIGPQPSEVNETAAAVMARDSSGRVLCQLRDDIEGVAAPGQWCLFGGQVEAGESLRAAAVREFEEETGLRFDEAELRPLAQIASTVKSDWNICIFELVTPVEPAQVRLGEGAGFAFLNPEQFHKFDFIETYRLFFETFFDGKRILPRRTICEL